MMLIKKLFGLTNQISPDYLIETNPLYHNIKQHIVQRYTINKKRIEENKVQFLETLEDLKLLSSYTTLEAKDVLSLIQSFSDTWFNLEQFDRGNFPKISNQTLITYVQCGGTRKRLTKAEARTY